MRHDDVRCVTRTAKPVIGLRKNAYFLSRQWCSAHGTRVRVLLCRARSARKLHVLAQHNRAVTIQCLRPGLWLGCPAKNRESYGGAPQSAVYAVSNRQHQVWFGQPHKSCACHIAGVETNRTREWVQTPSIQNSEEVFGASLKFWTLLELVDVHHLSYCTTYDVRIRVWPGSDLPMPGRAQP